MKIGTIHLVYYSATFTTQRISRCIAASFNAPVVEHDITMSPLQAPIVIPANELLILAMPVFGGLIPEIAAERLKDITGTDSPAIIVAVYGNRHYDNALCQMRDIATTQGFQVATAGAFIARHSIFSTIAADRPDDTDFTKAKTFAKESADIIASHDRFPRLDLPGKPDLIFRKPPLFPTADDTCTACGTCTDTCPYQAIPADNPQSTNSERCMACGRCIVVCPCGSRNFRGEGYAAGVARFEANFATRREPELFLPSL